MVGAVAVGELDGGLVVVSGGFDSTVRVWDLGTGGKPRVIRLDAGVISVTIPNSHFVVAGHHTGLTALRF